MLAHTLVRRHVVAMGLEPTFSKPLRISMVSAWLATQQFFIHLTADFTSQSFYMLFDMFTPHTVQFGVHGISKLCHNIKLYESV